MPSEYQTHLRTPVPADPAAAIEAGIGIWRAIAVDRPLRTAAGTMRVTSRRLQARADPLAFLAESGAGYQAEATTLSHDVTEAAFAEAT